MKRRCEELRDRLSSYLDGELPEDVRREVETHLAGCEACREVLAAYALVDTAVAQEPVRSETDWESLATRVDEVIERDEAPAPAPAPRRGFRFPIRPLAFGSAGTLAAALLVVLLYPWRGELIPEAELPSEIDEKSGFGLREEKAELDLGEEKREVAATLDEVLEEEGFRSKGPAEGGLYALESKESEADPRPRSVLIEAGAAGSAGKTRADDVDQRTEAKKRTEAEIQAESLRGLGYLSDEEAQNQPAAPPEADALGRDLATEPGATRGRISSVTVRIADADEPGGAKSPREVREWMARSSPPSAVIYDVAPGRSDFQSQKGEPAPARVKSDSDADLYRAALDLARSRLVLGHAADAREGFELLTGDLPDNVVREEAWWELLWLQTESVVNEEDPDEVLPVAKSADAFVAEYAGSAHSADVLGLRARLWARLAALDARHCPAARERALEWENRFPPGAEASATRDAIRRLRAEDCPE